MANFSFRNVTNILSLCQFFLTFISRITKYFVLKYVFFKIRMPSTVLKKSVYVFNINVKSEI